jgi:hypothetical protein
MNRFMGSLWGDGNVITAIRPSQFQLLGNRLNIYSTQGNGCSQLQAAILDLFCTGNGFMRGRHISAVKRQNVVRAILLYHVKPIILSTGELIEI